MDKQYITDNIEIMRRAMRLAEITVQISDRQISDREALAKHATLYIQIRAEEGSPVVAEDERLIEMFVLSYIHAYETKWRRKAK